MSKQADGRVPLSDAALVLGATMRATRLVVADDVPGRWWIKRPIDQAMDRYEAEEVRRAAQGGRDVRQPWWWEYRSGLDCGFCISVHVSYLVLGSYYIARALGPKPLAAWRFGAATLAVSYVAGHTWARLDKDPDDD